MRFRAKGFTLVELLIALVISLSLISAFLLLMHRTRVAFARNESLASLQDSARHALDVLSRGLPTRFVFLSADADVLRARLQQRPDHFAGVALLESQLAALEPPSHVLALDAALSVDALVARIRSTFGI